MRAALSLEDLKAKNCPGMLRILCAHAPDENTRAFLATQVADEARHEVFSKRLYRMGFTD